MTNITSEFFFPHSITLFVSLTMCSVALPLAAEDGGGFVFSVDMTIYAGFDSSSPTLIIFELKIPGLSNKSSRKISETIVL